MQQQGNRLYCGWISRVVTEEEEREKGMAREMASPVQMEDDDQRPQKNVAMDTLGTLYIIVRVVAQSDQQLM